MNGSSAEHAARVERAAEADAGVIADDEAGQPVVVREVRVDDVESVLAHEALEASMLRANATGFCAFSMIGCAKSWCPIFACSL